MGHSICKICQPRLTACPLCRIPYGNQSPIRALMTEKVIAKLPRKCIYQEHGFGCRQSELLPQKMLEHEKVCQYRPIRCVKPSCHSTFPRCMTLKHLERKHPEVDRTSRSSIAAFAQYALHQKLHIRKSKSAYELVALSVSESLSNLFDEKLNSDHQF